MLSLSFPLSFTQMHTNTHTYTHIHSYNIYIYIYYKLLKLTLCRVLPVFGTKYVSKFLLKRVSTTHSVSAGNFCIFFISDYTRMYIHEHILNRYIRGLSRIYPAILNISWIDYTFHITGRQIRGNRTPHTWISIIS